MVLPTILPHPEQEREGIDNSSHALYNEYGAIIPSLVLKVME
ncbi:hypothetical protein [Sphingobacterium athyrii]|nr:hypothetical protein [Sphingobacterium athyrii]